MAKLQLNQHLLALWSQWVVKLMMCVIQPRTLCGGIDQQKLEFIKFLDILGDKIGWGGGNASLKLFEQVLQVKHSSHVADHSILVSRYRLTLVTS